VIFCEHYVRDGLHRRRPKDLDQSLDLMCRHIDRIERVTGGHDTAALGSDLDGFIKPMLRSLEHMGQMRALVERLERRYGPEVAA
jgi:microsomal dipeptidase-like Zn-dependent dipeptidase